MRQLSLLQSSWLKNTDIYVSKKEAKYEMVVAGKLRSQASSLRCGGVAA